MLRCGLGLETFELPGVVPYSDELFWILMRARVFTKFCKKIKKTRQITTCYAYCWIVLIRTLRCGLTETFELPGVVPYPDEGRLATDHRRPSTFLTLAKANWLGETLGESKGLTLAPGLWHLGSVGEVCTIIDLRWRVAAEGLRLAPPDNDSSFCNVNKPLENVMKK